jgi:hypothetical protein
MTEYTSHWENSSLFYFRAIIYLFYHLAFLTDGLIKQILNNKFVIARYYYYYFVTW